jgi:AcrR family transcriptional regulator
MGKPHQQRKLEIIQSALSLAAEFGVKKVTTQAIADNVGIAQATVFRHFKTKDAIFAEAIGWLANHLFTFLASSFNADAEADERLKLLINRQLKFISQHKGVPRLLFSDRLHLESPTLKKAVQEIMQSYISKVALLLEQGVESGCFRADLDTEKTAEYIAALIQGLVMRWSIFDFEFDLEEQADELFDFINIAIISQETRR